MAPRRRFSPARSLNSRLTATVVGVVPCGIADWSEKKRGTLEDPTGAVMPIFTYPAISGQLLRAPFPVALNQPGGRGRDNVNEDHCAIFTPLSSYPKVLLLLFAVREILKGYVAVGYKVVGRNRCVVEHG